MITERAARRVTYVTVTCLTAFIVSCGVAYTQRGYLAVGGEYAFCLIPALTLALEWVRGGDM